MYQIKGKVRKKTSQKMDYVQLGWDAPPGVKNDGLNICVFPTANSWNYGRGQQMGSFLLFLLVARSNGSKDDLYDLLSILLNPKSPTHQIPKFPNIPIPKFPNPQISKYPNIQTLKFPKSQIPKITQAMGSTSVWPCFNVELHCGQTILVRTIFSTVL